MKDYDNRETVSITARLETRVQTCKAINNRATEVMERILFYTMRLLWFETSCLRVCWKHIHL